MPDDSSLRRDGAGPVDSPPGALVLAERRSLRDDVREAIVNAVISGEFAPGERIVETRVARQLGVSQTTVREALREIEHMGMAVSVPNRGVLVRPITRRDVVEMYEMRALCEGHAARLAVQHLDEASLSELERLLEEMIRLGDEEKTREMIAVDVEFHRFLMRLADHTLLSRLWSVVHPHLWTYTAVQGILGLHPGIVARRHLAIIEALRSGDPDRAEQAMRTHLLELRDIAKEKVG